MNTEEVEEEEEEDGRGRSREFGRCQLEHEIVPRNILFNPLINPRREIRLANEPWARLNINYVVDYVIKRVFVVIGRTGA